MYVLGLDPGFASIGFAVVRLGQTLEVVKVGVIRTKKSDAKRNVRASEDNLERAKEIAEAIQELLREYDFKLVCAETMSYPRNSAAAAKMAMCWGVLAAVSQQHGLPVAQATPQEVKKAVCNKRDASKEDVQKAVTTLFPSIGGLLDDTPRSMWEHPHDALAAVVACASSEVFLLARRMAVGSSNAGHQQGSSERQHHGSR